jgi:hypothetical protein
MSKTNSVKVVDPARPNPMLAALAGTPHSPTSENELQKEPKLQEADPAQRATRPAPDATEQMRATPKKSARPSRQNRRFMGGFFPPNVHKAMGYVMVEEDRTLQDLMEEAVHDFLVRKGQGKRLSPK